MSHTRLAALSWRTLYTVLLYLVLPWLLVRQLWRAWHTPENRPDWLEMLGYYRSRRGQAPIWLHAVSVGEVMAAAPFIRVLLREYPTVPLVVSTMTRTGRDRLIAMFGDAVQHVYAPYDLPGAARRFTHYLQPQIGIIFETELWPNWLLACRRRGIPVYLFNARLSARSARGYARVGAATREMLEGLAAIAAQTQDDAQRLIALGAPAEIVHVSGSSKFDIVLSDAQRSEGLALRSALGKDRPVWIAASTHEGEDELVLEAFRLLRRRVPNAVLILVPRHPERFGRVWALLQRLECRAVRRSHPETEAAQVDVFLGDSMGELMMFYAASDIAFVGGSLLPIGGHNVLEPCACGLPVLVGPHTFNFDGITSKLIDLGGAVRVLSAAQLSEQLVALMLDAAHRRQMAAAATAMLAHNQGALDAFMALLPRQLADARPH